MWGPGHRTPLVIIPNAAPARSFWRERFSVVSGKSVAATHRDRVRLDIQITQQICGKQRQHATISIFDTKTTHTHKNRGKHSNHIGSPPFESLKFGANKSGAQGPTPTGEYHATIVGCDAIATADRKHTTKTWQSHITPRSQVLATVCAR